jgi:hypothetical protein
VNKTFEGVQKNSSKKNKCLIINLNIGPRILRVPAKHWLLLHVFITS